MAPVGSHAPNAQRGIAGGSAATIDTAAASCDGADAAMVVVTVGIGTITVVGTGSGSAGKATVGKAGSELVPAVGVAADVGIAGISAADSVTDDAVTCCAWTSTGAVASNGGGILAGPGSGITGVVVTDSVGGADPGLAPLKPGNNSIATCLETAICSCGVSSTFMTRAVLTALPLMTTARF